MNPIPLIWTSYLRSLTSTVFLLKILLKHVTIANIAEGSEVMAILWQSAWKAGDGDAIANNKLKAIDQEELRTLYNNKKFVPSYTMKDTRFKDLLV